PNIVARLSERGIDFFGLIGHKLVNKELPKANFPNILLPIDNGPGSGQVNVSDLHILPSLFISPKFRFQLAPPRAIRFISKNGIVPIRGYWSAYYWLLGIKFSTSGWVEIVAENISSALELGIKHQNERPQFEVFSCFAANG
uniref:ANF_receptor domain-containing protein n=1 Tax=Meloidogyne hapla TaxID=6305 RepID=A0A1I8B3X8_MELHA